jgi:Tfp pilus assembly protein PilX
MKERKHVDRSREQGITLLVTVVMILLVGILVLTSIGHSGDESAAGARARATARALHAADGGMQLALARITQDPPNVNPINVTIGNMSVQSRTRADSAPQSLDSLGSGPPPEGYGINAGSGYVAELFRVDITSLGPTGSTAELQSKLYRFSGASGGY